jgi:hypothetical protein
MDIYRRLNRYLYLYSFYIANIYANSANTSNSIIGALLVDKDIIYTKRAALLSECSPFIVLVGYYSVIAFAHAV